MPGQTGMKRVRKKNRRDNVHWPPWKCACCGETINSVKTATLVVCKKVDEHHTHKWPMAFPSCAVCRDHQRIALGNFDWYSSGWRLGIVILGLLFVGGGVHLVTHGLLYMLSACVAWTVVFAILRHKWKRQNISAAKRRMKPTCTGPIFVDYRREPPEPSTEFEEIFEFSNEAYADEFRILNGVSRTTPGNFT